MEWSCSNDGAILLLCLMMRCQPTRGPHVSHVLQSRLLSGPMLVRVNMVLAPPTELDKTRAFDLANSHQTTVVLTADKVPAMGMAGNPNALYLADVGVTHGGMQTFTVLPRFLTRAAKPWLSQPMQAALQAEGLCPNKTQTLMVELSTPSAPEGKRSNAAALKNMIGLPVVTPGNDLGRQRVQRRVHRRVRAISSPLASATERSAELAELKPYVNREVTAQACRQALLTAPLQPLSNCGCTAFA